MKVSVISDGNSKGSKHSKSIFKKIKPIARKGWGKLFKKMNENGDDKLLLNDVFADEIFNNIVN